ncbi:hypothetical protein RC083_07630 [Pseudoalteromonas haloplanktis]|uniref:Orphan protein n=1 Tax=Pseudoalteromonas haloplanktis TaxID=228 RepID=A0ABU1BB18_PSEHA|nr:hypothetical protein [Pseudoalteromonas haloplanktis]MDQ9091457.1 hypothetical protein [Pseudoalteromonas haloplanktis]
MKISPVFNLPEAKGFQSNYEKHLAEKRVQEDDEPEYTLSEFLDAKAQQYSDEDASFAGQYENLEKVYDDLEQKINVLQAQISKLKQDPIQRHLQLESATAEVVKSEQSEEQQSLKIAPEHTGVKRYRESQQQEQIDILMQQLNELQSKQAEVKQQMIDMVITELKKRDNEEYKL